MKTTPLRSDFNLRPRPINLLVLSMMTLLLSCSGQPKNLPNERKYEEYTTLMLNVCGKFAEETDANKLHKAAVSTQTVRLISCSDFNDECTLYGQFISLVIKTSADGNITPSERADIHARLAELGTAIDNGKKMLREEWSKKK